MRRLAGTATAWLQSSSLVRELRALGVRSPFGGATEFIALGTGIALALARGGSQGLVGHAPLLWCSMLLAALRPVSAAAVVIGFCIAAIASGPVDGLLAAAREGLVLLIAVALIPLVVMHVAKAGGAVVSRAGSRLASAAMGITAFSGAMALLEGWFASAALLSAREPIRTLDELPRIEFPGLLLPVLVALLLGLRAAWPAGTEAPRPLMAVHPVSTLGQLFGGAILLGLFWPLMGTSVARAASGALLLATRLVRLRLIPPLASALPARPSRALLGLTDLQRTFVLFALSLAVGVGVGFGPAASAVSRLRVGLFVMLVVVAALSLPLTGDDTRAPRTDVPARGKGSRRKASVALLLGACITVSWVTGFQGAAQAQESVTVHQRWTGDFGDVATSTFTLSPRVVEGDTPVTLSGTLHQFNYGLHPEGDCGYSVSEHEPIGVTMLLRPDPAPLGWNAGAASLEDAVTIQMTSESLTIVSHADCSVETTHTFAGEIGREVLPEGEAVSVVVTPELYGRQGGPDFPLTLAASDPATALTVTPLLETPQPDARPLPPVATVAPLPDDAGVRSARSRTALPLVGIVTALIGGAAMSGAGAGSAPVIDTAQPQGAESLRTDAPLPRQDTTAESGGRNLLRGGQPNAAATAGDVPESDPASVNFERRRRRDAEDPDVPPEP